MEVARFVEYLVHSYQTTRRHIPVDRNLKSDEFNETADISQLIRKPFMQSVG
jgi:hypothetical protein